MLHFILLYYIIGLLIVFCSPGGWDKKISINLAVIAIYSTTWIVVIPYFYFNKKAYRNLTLFKLYDKAKIKRQKYSQLLKKYQDLVELETLELVYYERGTKDRELFQAQLTRHLNCLQRIKRLK